MPDELPLDLVALGFAMQGIARSMEAIPKDAWLEIVQTATGTFKSIVHPITATTGGVGRWIDQKFDNMVEVEKVLLADGLLKAMQRIEASARSVNPKPNLAVIAPLIEGVSLANEEFMREMWINLLSRELSGAEVHPEFVNVLKRLSPSDARLLAEIARDSEANMTRIRAERARVRDGGSKGTVSSRSVVKILSREFDLREEVLASLNLVEPDRIRMLSEFGEHFLESVSELNRPSS